MDGNPMDGHRALDVAALFARAFHADPFMSHAFPDGRRREAQLRAVFRPVVRASRRWGGVVTDVGSGADAGAVVGAVAWLAGAHFPLSAGRLLTSGMLALPFLVPPAGLRRLQRHEGFAEHELAAREIAADVRRGTAYLWVAGVEPAAQGTGVGGRVIRRALEAMAETHRRCVLKTENPANLPIYARLGFREERRRPAPGSGIPVWFLSRSLER